MRKTIFLLLGIYIFANNLHSQPRFRLDKPFYNFGRVNEGSIIEQQVIIKNIGNQQLVVNIRTSCRCIVVDKQKIIVEPSQQTQIKIKFNTTGYSENVTEYVFFHTNDPENKYIRWLIEGNVLSTKKKFYTTETSGESKKNIVVVKMFFTRGCFECKKIKQQYIPKLEKKLDIKVQVEEYPLEIPQNYELFVSYEEQLQDLYNKLPAIIVGDKILGGEKEIKKELELQLLKMINRDISSVKIEPQKSINFIPKHVEMLHVGTIIIAGFVDGINPCAFATIVFLIAYLTIISKKATKEVVLTGLFFIAGVFVTYLSIGFILKNLFIINIKNVLGKILYVVLGIITLTAAGISFSDVVAIKKIEAGKNAKVWLRLPDSFRMKIYDIVEKFARDKHIIPIGFILGVIISLIEFFCTGQIYLPTILYMFAYQELRTKAVLYLILYCFMFVLPLIIIFVSLLFGLKSEIIESIGRRYVKTVKFVTGIVFLILSIWMFSVIF